MKITKTQLRQIIKEELKDYYSLASEKAKQVLKIAEVMLEYEKDIGVVIWKLQKSRKYNLSAYDWNYIEKELTRKQDPFL